MNRICPTLLALLMLTLGAATPAQAQAQAQAQVKTNKTHEPPSAKSPAREGAAASYGRPRTTLSGVVNLNQADGEALELLPGVGPARAAAIVEYRKIRPFKKVDDLIRIKGIGKKTMTQLRPYLTVSGPTTLTAEQVDDGGDGREAKD